MNFLKKIKHLIKKFSIVTSLNAVIIKMQTKLYTIKQYESN